MKASNKQGNFGYWSDTFKDLTLEEVMSDITDVQNSLNINLTGIHAFENLFRVKLYEK